MRPEHQSHASILRFWRDVEIFEPQRIPKPSKKDHVIDLAPGSPAPWDPVETAARGPLNDNEIWQYKIYCGVFSLDATFDVLKDLVGEDPDVYEARSRGEAALAGFVLDSTGRLIPQTATLSSSAWGLGRINALQMRPGWAEGFRSAQKAFEAAFIDLLNPRTTTIAGSRELLEKLAALLLAADGTEDPDTLLTDVRAIITAAAPAPDAKRPASRTPVMDHPRLDAVRQRLLTITGTTDLLPQSDPPIRIQCVKLTLKKDQKEAERTPDFDFLNSHLADDLDAVADAAHTGDIGPALATYLTAAHDTARRVDVRGDLNAVWEATRPARIPLGRWPAPAEHALALGQQLAVNNALDPASGALQGVNGPPGTGKSTLLRDLFAAIITERALRLADLDYPSYGLQPRSADRHFSVQGRKATVPLLAPELTGFELVVASSNNGAVENVTRETPHAGAIDARWAGAVDYFTEIGARVLNADRLKKDTKEWEPTWALLAAVLGNSSNRSRFVNAFWFDLQAGRGSSIDDPGLQKRLKAATEPEDWKRVRDRFRAAEALVLQMAAERDSAYEAWRREAQLAADLETATGAADAAKIVETAAREAHADLEHRLATAQSGLEQAERARTAWDATRPGLWHRLVRTGRWKAWQARAEVCELAYLAAWDAHQDLTAQVPQAAEQRDAAVRASAAADRHRAQIAATYLQCQQEVEAARDRYGSAFPHEDDGTDPDAARRLRELAAPWSDAAFNAARSELFLEALRLHRAFIEHNANRIGPGLGVAVDIIKRSVPADLHPHTRLAAWQLLFMVVPIVSTTFASLARQFDGLGPDALGWSLIDEAGQATPQAAAGAIWRSRRVVAVGDPLQLEPIVSLPHTIEDAIRRHHGLPDLWVPSNSSVQRLADAGTRYGTTLPGPDGAPLWIGCPLTVHRRCEEPMFSLSNRIAYNQLMLSDTPDRGPFTFPGGAEIFRSGWFHVAPASNDGHWIPDEGRRLDDLLAYLRDGGFDMKEVMVITPFVEVKRRLEQRARTYRLGAAGTVNTAQGKQADIVVIVLGGDPAKPRASSFAAEKPNFVNVAVSRAKRRLYVIGDHDAWSARPHFSQLAAALGEPHRRGRSR